MTASLIFCHFRFFCSDFGELTLHFFYLRVNNSNHISYISVGKKDSLLFFQAASL